jgi:hypothetical protein
MVVKIYWERCPLFVVEEEDAFFLEASPSETESSILPFLTPAEKVKFEQLKDVYIAKASSGIVHEGCYYFLVSRGAHVVKFESIALMTSDLSTRGGKAKTLPDLPIAKVADIDAIDPSKY